jgi:ABC-2 type transport system ATP-binding protein
VEPRFEDAFIDRLAAAVGSGRAPAPLPTAATTSRPGSGASREQPSKATHAVRPGGDAPPIDAPAIDAPVIEVSGLQRRFGRFVAVKGLDFEVRRGEIFGLLGANGAGKSTTFRMLCGLLPASAGKVRVAGLDMRRSAPRARGRLGYMAQRFSMYGDLSVLQNLRFFSSAYGLRGEHQRARIDWALATFELEDIQRERSGDLPLGFKQRLAMAAALLHEPEILFLDEPTSGVDALVRREFWQRINALAESGTTILVTTHFMDEANYCDRLVIMADGEVLAAGTPMALIERARRPQQPEPTFEDAFIALISAHRKASEQAA